MTTNEERGTGAEPPLGSAAEEAARLMEALRRWVDDRGLSVPTMPNVATGSTECKMCPFCQLLSMLRDSQPEVFEHLGTAAESLLAAVRSAIAAHESRWSGPGSRDVEHIDIDE